MQFENENKITFFHYLSQESGRKRNEKMRTRKREGTKEILNGGDI